MSSSGSIFISYRRSDSIAETGRIYDRLATEFGRDHVFKDVDSIPFGVDFAEYLDQAVSQCQVVLVIIGRTWLTVTEPDGTRRLDNPDDFVRIEVESALRRGIPVIPVLLQGVGMPRRPQLPASLQPLARRNGIEVGYDPRFHADMNRLIKGLRINFGEAIPLTDGGAKGIEVSTVYDLRGAQFAGGFAGTVGGDQLGGTINNPGATKSVSKSPVSESQTSGKSQQAPVSQPQISDPLSNLLVEDLGNGVRLDMVYIPEGDFLMGSPDGEAERDDDEDPQHQVYVSAFYMGKYPVTQAQWQAVAKLKKIEIDLEHESDFQGNDLPVEWVSWFEAAEFCQRLSKHTGNSYRLPSEAEWEYACRAGTITPFYFGETISADQANYNGDFTYGNGEKGEFRGKITAVGGFPANSFELCDMHGNMWEWCQDYWHENYEGAPKNSSAWVQGGDSGRRIIRGGSWDDFPEYCRSAVRLNLTPDDCHTDISVGFRVVCSAPRSLS